MVIFSFCYEHNNIKQLIGDKSIFWIMWPWGSESIMERRFGSKQKHEQEADRPYIKCKHKAEAVK